MSSEFIRVSGKCDGTWGVFRGSSGLVLLAFRLKAHAIAYARAISSSRGFTLFIDDKYGTAIRQSSSSMTYPQRLD